MIRIGDSCRPVLLLGLLGIMIPGGAGGAACNGAEPTDQARKILDTSGVTGGLVVHLGCGDGQLTAALGADEKYLVHGLETDPGKLERARAHLRARGLYGPVSVGAWDGVHLPHAENLVNLIVSAEPGEVAMDEMMRVLAPLGVVLVHRDGTWQKTVKPWPAAIDQWTHYLHGPNNNAVADDAVVGPPRRLQWVCPPLWSRSHEHLATLSAAVSARGRLFYILDEGPTVDVTMPPKWSLLARDAFNGVLLWKREIEPWEWRLRPFRSGPPHLARRLVAVGDRVYATLGYGRPLVALDAATGEILHTYAQTENTQEIVLSDGVLYVVVGEAAPDTEAQAQRAAESKRKAMWWPVYDRQRPRTRLLAVDAASGQMIWTLSGPAAERIMATTLAVESGRVFFQNLTHVVCLDAREGKEIWRAERPVSPRRPAWSTPTLVVYDGVVISGDRRAPEDADSERPPDPVWTVTISSQGRGSTVGELIAFAAETGQRLWSAPCREGWTAPVDVLVADGLVWSGDLVADGDPGIVRGLDPHTGEVVRTRPRDQKFYQPIMNHARCHRSKATEQYLITSRSGVEFVDVGSGEAIPQHWVRGECQYGILPCNGLLYAPPHACTCFLSAKLNSFLALAPGPEEVERADVPVTRLQKGPAYDMVESPADLSGDWPTYRHDAGRSGSTTARVAPQLDVSWETRLEAPLTAPVSAGGHVYVASTDTHTVHALEVETGKPLWQFTAGGRVDSPPTIWRGRVLFGSVDGWVYCLRAEDGALVWRYRAAPTDRLIVAHGQLESPWPVHGSVVVLPTSDSAKAVVFASAGRSGYLDDGIVLVRLDAESGRELSRTALNSRDPKTGQQPRSLPRPVPPRSMPKSLSTCMPGVLNDILSVQHGSLFMRHRRFSLDGIPQEETAPHLYSPAGFLDDSWWHRTYWLVGLESYSGWQLWYLLANLDPSGRLLVLDDECVYGFGRDRHHRDGSHVGLGGAAYRLFAHRQSSNPRRETGQKVFRWQKRIAPLVRAMVLADKTLFVAGPDDPFSAEDPVAVWQGRGRGLVWAVSAESGEKLAEYEVDAPPVFDGLIATSGRVFLTTTDGRVWCFSGRSGQDRPQ